MRRLYLKDCPTGPQLTAHSCRTLTSWPRETSIPTLYKIDKQRKLVLTMGFGFVTKKEVLILQDRMSNDPEFNPGFSQVVDFAELTATDIGLADVQTFAQRDAFSIYSRRAIVVKGNAAFGFAKIFELCCQLWGARGIQVFRNLDEAFEWVFSPASASALRHTESAALPESRRA